MKNKNAQLRDNLDELSSDEVIMASKELNKCKMCGHDCVYNEHILYGGLMLNHYLTFLFNLMYRYDYVPCNLKLGTIVTLHKGNGKRKDIPNNYRAITLSSSILKLYEKLLLGRLQNRINSPIHPLQGGFRKI